MDSHSTGLIITLAVLVLLSAYFSATETAFSSLNRIKLKNMASIGNKKAKLAYRLSENYDELLSTILVGNNLVNIASTAIATILFVRWFGDLGVTISTIVMTVVVLIFGEISPKSLAKEAPESFAAVSASYIRALMVLLKPVNFFFSKLKLFLKRAFKLSSDRSITDTELLTMVEEAEQGGSMDSDESALIKNVIEFNELSAIDIFTPRVDVVAVQAEDSADEVAKVFRESGYSRIPVYGESIDDIVGIIHEKDFYSYVFATENDISSILKPCEFIPPSMRIPDLLRLLQKNKFHMAVIVDEFGGTEGVVTLEDVIEELVGEIWDEHDVVTEQIKCVSDGLYRVFCTTDLDDLFEFFNIFPITEASTINGWMAEMLDKIPVQGDSFSYEGIVFTVGWVENNRVTEITVRGKPLPKKDGYSDGE